MSMAADGTPGASTPHGHGPIVVVVDDPDAVALEGARLVRAAATRAMAGRGVFRLTLAGGSTPRRLYARLAAAPVTDAMDWAHVQLFFGDERCVPPQHPDSNFGMVQSILLDRINILSGNVHRMRGEESDPAAAAAAYARELSRPLDLALLGIGSDGHTASLFPHTGVLGETVLACMAVDGPVLRTTRLTLTLPVFLETREILFLVTGSEKAEILREVVCGPLRPLELPSQSIVRRAGPVTILCDRAAAVLLPDSS